MGGGSFSSLTWLCRGSEISLRTFSTYISNIMIEKVDKNQYQIIFSKRISQYFRKWLKLKNFIFIKNLYTYKKENEFFIRKNIDYNLHSWLLSDINFEVRNSKKHFSIVSWILVQPYLHVNKSTYEPNALHLTPVSSL